MKKKLYRQLIEQLWTKKFQCNQSADILNSWFEQENDIAFINLFFSTIKLWAYFKECIYKNYDVHIYTATVYEFL